MAHELNINLKPCPFCGVKPTIRWESWKEISPNSGCYVLEANHTNDCFIMHMNGTNKTGRISSFNAKCIVDWWNRRASEEKQR